MCKGYLEPVMMCSCCHGSIVVCSSQPVLSSGNDVKHFSKCWLESGWDVLVCRVEGEHAFSCIGKPGGGSTVKLVRGELGRNVLV